MSLQENLLSLHFYEKMFTVDFKVEKNFESGPGTGKFIADHSYSFLDWQIIDEIHNMRLKISQIDKITIAELCLNIMPGGNTILHELSSHGDLINEIYKLSQPKSDKPEIIKFHIPFINNIEGISPMERCSDAKTQNSLLAYLRGYGIDHHSRSIIKMYPLFVEK